MNATYNKRLYGMSMVVLVLVLAAGAQTDASDYYSPTALAVDDAGQYLYIAEYTAGQVQEFNTTTKAVTRTLSLTMPPTGVAISSSGLLYVTAGGIYGKVYVINISLWILQNTIDVGHTPMSPVLNGDELLLYVCNRFDGTVSKIGTASGAVLTTIDVLREPIAAAITPSSDKLVVANHLPDGPANTGSTAASVSIIDTSTQAVTNIQLTNGSTGMRGVCVSPDGSYAYVTHVLGRYQLPTSQLERGWVMTNAFSVIDISSETLVNTVLVDDVEMGAANPWDRMVIVTNADTAVFLEGSLNPNTPGIPPLKMAPIMAPRVIITGFNRIGVMYFVARSIIRTMGPSDESPRETISIA